MIRSSVLRAGIRVKKGGQLMRDRMRRVHEKKMPDNRNEKTAGVSIHDVTDRQKKEFCWKIAQKGREGIVGWSNCKRKK